MNGPIPFTEDQIADMCSRYRRGASLLKLSEHFGISITAVKYRLKINRVKLRRPGAPSGKRKSRSN